MVIIIGLVVAVFISLINSNKIDSFASCVKAGHPVIQSYPEKCIDKERAFTNPKQLANPPSEQVQ